MSTKDIKALVSQYVDFFGNVKREAECFEGLNRGVSVGDLGGAI